MAGAKSNGYSGKKRSALGLFIHYVREDRCNVILADLRTQLEALVAQPAALSLESAEAPEEGASRSARPVSRPWAHRLPKCCAGFGASG